jgi:hypothetical protein
VNDNKSARTKTSYEEVVHENEKWNENYYENEKYFAGTEQNLTAGEATSRATIIVSYFIITVVGSFENQIYFRVCE